LAGRLDAKFAKKTRMVKAFRNGQEAGFTEIVWGLLPADKNGWSEVRPSAGFTPPEVATPAAPNEPDPITEKTTKNGTGKK
jgi:hypothetical protein